MTKINTKKLKKVLQIQKMFLGLQCEINTRAVDAQTYKIVEGFFYALKHTPIIKDSGVVLSANRNIGARVVSFAALSGEATPFFVALNLKRETNMKTSEKQEPKAQKLRYNGHDLHYKEENGKLFFNANDIEKINQSLPYPNPNSLITILNSPITQEYITTSENYNNSKLYHIEVINKDTDSVETIYWLVGNLARLYIKYISIDLLAWFDYRLDELRDAPLKNLRERIATIAYLNSGCCTLEKEQTSTK